MIAPGAALGGKVVVERAFGEAVMRMVGEAVHEGLRYGGPMALTVPRASLEPEDEE